MAIKNMERCSASPVMNEIHIKTTWNWQKNFSNWQKIEGLKYTVLVRVLGNRPSYTLVVRISIEEAFLEGNLTKSINI